MPEYQLHFISCKPVRNLLGKFSFMSFLDDLTIAGSSSWYPLHCDLGTCISMIRKSKMWMCPASRNLHVLLLYLVILSNQLLLLLEKCRLFAPYKCSRCPIDCQRQLTGALWSGLTRRLKSGPSITRKSWPGRMMPHLVAIDRAVLTLSPVTILTVIPARWHLAIASGTLNTTNYTVVLQTNTKQKKTNKSIENIQNRAICQTFSQF